MELWFNIKTRGWKEISGRGEEGAKGGGKAIADQIVGSNFVDALTLKDMITDKLLRWPHGQKGLSVSLNKGRRSLRLRAGRKIQGGTQFSGRLRQREMSG